MILLTGRIHESGRRFLRRDSLLQYGNNFSITVELHGGTEYVMSIVPLLDVLVPENRRIVNRAIFRQCGISEVLPDMSKELPGTLVFNEGLSKNTEALAAKRGHSQMIVQPASDLFEESLKLILIDAKLTRYPFGNESWPHAFKQVAHEPSCFWAL